MKTTVLKIMPVMLILGISTTMVKCQQKQAKDSPKPPHEMSMTAELTDAQEGKVPTSYVCFVNNKYMGKEQIPVTVEGKTYYGCCMGCVNNLKNNRATRYSVDPLSGKEVDKANAYIILRTASDGKVQYFESEENYLKYKEANGKSE